jgi:hypothetical protein
MMRKVIGLVILGALALAFSGCEDKPVSKVDALVKRVKKAGLTCEQLSMPMFLDIQDKELQNELTRNLSAAEYDEIYDKVCKK